MGLKGGRYFNVDIAESITLMGQYLIKATQKWFEENGYTVIYGDTDSIFVYDKGKEIDHVFVLEKYHVWIKDHLKQFGIEKSWIQLNYDKCYKHFIAIVKKQYIGVLKDSNKLTAKGHDLIKRDTLEYTRKALQEILKMLFEGRRNEIKAYVEKIKEEVVNKKLTPKDVVIIKRIGKPLGTYKTRSIHAEIAQKRYDRIGRVDTNEVSYVITKNAPKMEAVDLDEYEGNYAVDYYWNDKILRVLTRTLEAVVPEVEWETWVIGYRPKVDPRQSSLFDFL